MCGQDENPVQAFASSDFVKALAVSRPCRPFFTMTGLLVILEAPIFVAATSVISLRATLVLLCK